MVIKMLTQLGTRVDELSDSFNKEIANGDKNQNQRITEMKNTREGINKQIRECQRISDLEDGNGKHPCCTAKRKEKNFFNGDK